MQKKLKYRFFKYHQMLIGALYLNPSPRKILMLGLGGGRCYGQKYIQALVPDYRQFDIVEIHPDLKQIAKDFSFFEENKKTKVFIEDAYQVC